MTEHLDRPAPITFGYCGARDLGHLEWGGLFTPHRRIIEETYAASRRGEQVMLLACAGDCPIGQIWIDLVRKREAGTAVFWAFRVHPWYRSRGIGRVLLRRAERELIARGYELAEIEVQPENAFARSFYEHAGYRPERTFVLDWSYRDPDDVHVTVTQELLAMVKPLRPDVPHHSKALPEVAA